MNKKKILAIAPHTDDIELGCGATLHKFRNEYEIHAVAITSAQPLAVGDPVQEFHDAMAIIKADSSFLDFECRILNESRQSLLDIFWNLQKQHQYDIVFCPSSYDHHQDHQVVYQEAFRAFKHSTILGYELPWNVRSFQTDVFISVNEEDMNAKLQMLDCYKTQQERAFMCKDYIFDIARTRGLQVGKQYVEAFEAIRIIDLL
jgi:LmbE family N-acetylglucosaminyl deacetylase